MSPFKPDLFPCDACGGNTYYDNGGDGDTGLIAIRCMNCAEYHVLGSFTKGTICKGEIKDRFYDNRWGIL